MTHQPSPQFYIPKYGEFLSPEGKLYRDNLEKALKEESNAVKNADHQ